MLDKRSEAYYAMRDDIICIQNHPFINNMYKNLQTGNTDFNVSFKDEFISNLTMEQGEIFQKELEKRLGHKVGFFQYQQTIVWKIIMTPDDEKDDSKSPIDVVMDRYQKTVDEIIKMRLFFKNDIKEAFRNVDMWEKGKFPEYIFKNYFGIE